MLSFFKKAAQTAKDVEDVTPRVDEAVKLDPMYVSKFLVDLFPTDSSFLNLVRLISMLRLEVVKDGLRMFLVYFIINITYANFYMLTTLTYSDHLHRVICVLAL
jgi:hypothetical protein